MEMGKLLLSVLLLWVSALTQAQVVRNNNVSPDDVKVRELVNKYTVSINNADSISGYNLFAHSGRVSFIHARGYEQNWQEISRNIDCMISKKVDRVLKEYFVCLS